MHLPACFARAIFLGTIHTAAGLAIGRPAFLKEAGGTRHHRHDHHHASSSKGQHFLDHLSIDGKRAMWWRLTEDLQKSHGWPIPGDKPLWPIGPGERALLNEWNRHIGTKLNTTYPQAKWRCSETGDGHFLKDAFGEVCGETLVVDLFDSNADVKMDLNLRPADAPEPIKKAMNTMDVVVSHQVFEHLQRPSVGIANLNALLKVGGTLVLSTPFVTPDHQGPGDDFLRWTVRGLHNFAKCAGFDVQELRGLGDRFEEIAYLAGVRADMMGSSHMGVGCDGLASDDCKDLFFAAVAVLGTKRESKTVQEIHECFG
mmetsp:Transcript_124901/g.221290  ORF Transcript_124901/g.221290 Transcript_124901/m.221290 type:complete len:314 (+) Transcript_124901:82-1023(+)